MGDRVTAYFIIAGDSKQCPLMTGQLQDHERKAQFEHDLQRDQAAKGVVVSLLRRRKKTCDQGNGDQACGAGPESRKNRESYSSIKPQDVSYPVTSTRDTGCIQLERRQFP